METAENKIVDKKGFPLPKGDVNGTQRKQRILMIRGNREHIFLPSVNLHVFLVIGQSL